MFKPSDFALYFFYCLEHRAIDRAEIVARLKTMQALSAVVALGVSTFPPE